MVSFLSENIRSRERTNFVNGLLDCPSTMSSGHKMILQVPSMGRKVRIVRADTAESEGLTIRDAGFAVTGMAARRVEVLVGICGFGVESSGDAVRLFLDGDIEEVGRLVGKIRGEFDGPVERIEVINKGVEALFLPGPDEENIVDVAPPNPRSTGC